MIDELPSGNEVAKDTPAAATRKCRDGRQRLIGQHHHMLLTGLVND